MVSSKRLSAYLRNKGNIFKEIALAAFSIFMTVRVKGKMGFMNFPNKSVMQHVDSSTTSLFNYLIIFFFLFSYRSSWQKSF